MKAILEAGLKLPDDIAVVGAGNVRYSDVLAGSADHDRSGNLQNRCAGGRTFDCANRVKALCCGRKKF